MLRFAPLEKALVFKELDDKFYSEIMVSIPLLGYRAALSYCANISNENIPLIAIADVSQRIRHLLAPELLRSSSRQSAEAPLRAQAYIRSLVLRMMPEIADSKDDSSIRPYCDSLLVPGSCGVAVSNRTEVGA